MPAEQNLARTRDLFVHDDPAAVGAWCRARVEPGVIHVVPSPLARRLALQEKLGGHDAVVGLTVITRARLLPLLEARAGLTTPQAMSASLERLLVTRTAQRAGVPLFDAEELAPAGAVHVVTRVFRSLRLNGVSPDAYREAGGDVRIADAYARFEQMRASHGALDETDRVTRLIDAGLPSVPLVLEDPSWPHLAAVRLHEAVIAASRSCSIGVSRLLAEDPPIVAHLRSLGFEHIAERAADHRPAMRAIGGAGMHDEVELVARHMLSLLRARPASRPSEILGVAPTAKYLSMLHESCARIGIPIATPRRLRATEVPLVRALLEAFRLLADDEADTPSAGLALLATPYVGLSLGRHDRLARALIRRGRGAMRDWETFAAKESSPRFRALAAAIPTLANGIARDQAPRRLATTMRALANRFGFITAGRRHHLTIGDDEALRLDQQGWDAIDAAMDELSVSLGASGVTRVASVTWLAQLTDALSGVSIRADARPVDGVQLTVAGAGLPAVGHVFAVGWRDGLMPRRVREEPFLSDQVKIRLNEAGARFFLSTDRVNRDLEHRARIVRAARGSLTVSWPAFGADGDRLLPSRYIDDLGIEPGMVREVGDGTWHSTLAVSRAEQLSRATVIARHRSLEAVGVEAAHARATLASLTESERQRWNGAGHAPQASDLPVLARTQLAEKSRESSASQSKYLAHCLYEHFGKKRLELKPLSFPELDRLKIGSLSHNVLQTLTAEQFAEHRVDEILADAWRDPKFDVFRGTPTAQFELEVLREQLAAVAKSERAYLAKDGYERSYAELGFGVPFEGRDPASRRDGLDLLLPGDAPVASVNLRGSIDRVDVYVRDGRRVAIAIDYKSGSGSTNYKEMRGLADFQLPIYCEVLKLFDLEPVGAFYVSIRSGKRLGVIHTDFEDLAPTTDTQRLGDAAFQDYLAERMDALRGFLVRAARGDVEATPRADDCGFCELRPVCRIGTFRAAGEPVDE